MSELGSGQSVGRYRIQKILGAGAMGVVYLAEDPQIGRLLAIKTVRLAGGSPADIEDRKQRLLREAKTAGGMIHPNIVTLFDAGEHDGELYLAFEFVDGSSLADFLAAKGPLALGEALRITREVAEGLGHAHEKGVVHRDIKPANILVAKSGQVKVSDFGIAKIVGQATELTVTGTVVGSPHYLSPEQVRGEPLDGASDVFSLGVVFYELLGGQRPFDGETFTTLLYQILHQEPPPIRLNPALLPHVADVLRKMLAKDRHQRYAHGAEAARAIADLARQLTPAQLAAPAVTSADVAPTRLFSTAELSVVPSPPPIPTAPPPGTMTGQHPPPLPPSPPPVPSASPAPPVVPLGPQGGAAVAKSGGQKKLLIGLAAGCGVLVVLAAVLVVFLGGKFLPLGGGGKTPPKVAANDAIATPNPQPAPQDPAPANPTPSQRPAVDPANPTPPPAATPRNQLPAERPPVVERLPPRVQERIEDRRTQTPPVQNVPTPIVTPEPPPVREAEPEPEPERRRASGPVDREMNTGMMLVLDVLPKDAHVVLDGRVIGRASDYGPKSPYRLPDPGEYVLAFKKDGMRTFRLKVAASERPGNSLVQVRLAMEGTPTTDVGDLAQYRARRGVALRITPEEAEVFVDGNRRGRAREFRGGVRKELLMAPGRHRVTFSAQGFQPLTVLVDITGGADEDFGRIEVSLERER